MRNTEVSEHLSLCSQLHTAAFLEMHRQESICSDWLTEWMNENVSPLTNKHVPSFRKGLCIQKKNTGCCIYHPALAVTNLSKLLDFLCLSFLISMGKRVEIGDINSTYLKGYCEDPMSSYIKCSAQCLAHRRQGIDVSSYLGHVTFPSLCSHL